MKYIWLAVLSIVLLSCSEARKNTHENIIGIYTYSFPFFSESLELKADHTFIYSNRSCTNELKSKGTWVLVDDDLIITSHEEDKDHKSYDLKPVEIDHVEPNLVSLDMDSTIYILNLNLEEYYTDSTIYFHNKSFKVGTNELIEPDSRIKGKAKTLKKNFQH